MRLYVRSEFVEKTLQLLVEYVYTILFVLPALKVRDEPAKSPCRNRKASSSAYQRNVSQRINPETTCNEYSALPVNTIFSYGMNINKTIIFCVYINMFFI